MLSLLSHSARPLLIALILALCSPASLLAQQDSIVVVAGERYHAGALQELLFGRSYRQLWTAPVRVEVLDPTRFAGGLVPLRSGGGGSSKTLRLQGGDGRRYVFRTIDKDAMRTLSPELEGTPAAAIVQDQVSAKHPGAALVVPPLLDAAGVLHVRPRLFVMPDHPFLGEFRAEFAGRLGTIEERPEDGDGEEETHPGFAGAVRVVSSERLLRHLDADPRHRIDSRAYLTARLVDVLIGDWDRHPDQWRWARFDEADGMHLWRPIPRDRDNAFASHEGLALRVARTRVPRLVEFHRTYPDIYGLTMNARPLDSRFLADLPREVWDSVASTLQGRITDEVIAAGIARLPDEYRTRSGAELAAKLRSRRDHLPEAARRFYALLASEADVHGTDEADLAEIDRLREGRVEVRLYGRGPGGTRSVEPFFQRTFRPEETREIRIHLAGGDDRVVLRGEAKRSIGVRLIGAEGNDTLVDSSRVRGGSGRATLYDHLGENAAIGRSARLDGRAYTPPSGDGPIPGDGSFRDWGSVRVAFAPWVDWRSNVGPVVGGGPVLTRYGFRRYPYAHRMALRALVAPTLGRFGVEYTADVRSINSGMRLELLARATDIEVTRFHGLGNQTLREGDDARYKIEEREFSLEPAVYAPLARGLELFTGPIFRYTNPRLQADAPAAQLEIRGTRPFGQIGAQVGAVLDRRDSPTFPRQGVLLQLTGAGYPAAWSDAEPFARAALVGSAYLTPPARPGPTLALRAGASRSLGDFPLQEASFVGGSGTLRGYPDQRFAGEAALFGGSELRVRLAPVKLIVRGDLGAFGLADAARVYVGGESPGGWHTGYGGGLWISLLDGKQVFSAAYARGEEHRLYLRMGLGF